MNKTSTDWDTSNRDEFVSYYSAQSISPDAIDRAQRVRDLLVKIRDANGCTGQPDVLDIGCNVGTYCFAWVGHAKTIAGVDISEELIEIARVRANESGANIEFHVGSATDLPLSESNYDVCISPELLEHVSDWRACLDEYCRVLRPGGVLYLTTTNRLCPKQQEFNLLFYSWYPRAIKKWIERLAVTTRPDLANYATYPAVNWFSYYSLRKELVARGFETMDRFDIIKLTAPSGRKKLAAKIIGSNFLVRWFGHVCTPSSIVVATKSGSK